MDKDPVSVLRTFIVPILKSCFLNYSIIVTNSSLVYPERNGKNWICQVSALLFKVVLGGRVDETPISF